MAPKKEAVVFRLLLLSSFSTIHLCQKRSTTKDIQDMPVRCAVCSECVHGVRAIYGSKDQPLYPKKGKKDIKNCTKASLQDNFPCRHNGTIILPTNDTYQTYHFEVNKKSIEVKPTDCPSLDLTPIVTPDPHRDSNNTFMTTPSLQGTNGFLIGGCVAGKAAPDVCWACASTATPAL
ncbi:hypothetical protein AGOR_G00222180 [Albula goreensis]|uniref:Uncharacterized protein n=1 Tax=Albula goreensis TaxID=1534307 RepID=A0A8T3CJM4_9TELE|nr:hypothetical protein AGOR_G00222180 [Albula goreensis]